jgi:hypothetical protein
VVEDGELRQRLLRAQHARRGAYGAQRMVDAWRDLYLTMADTGLAARGSRHTRL